VLLGLAGGAALTAAQAARRTDTAFARALADARASDAVVNADTFTYDPSESAQLPWVRMAVIRVSHMRALTLMRANLAR